MDNDLRSGSIKRINVVGTSGSGKSTFCKKLAAIIDAPYVEMDKIYWRPNWTTWTEEEFFGKVEQELNRKKWVLDGNYTSTTPVKWKNVQMVIWLDYSFLTVMSRSIKRTLWRAISREELWEGTGNKESLSKMFSRDSIVLWAYNTYDNNRVKYAKMMADDKYAHIRFVRLSSPLEAETFLNEIRSRT
jgi:adenylate kinase family enzyme